MTIMEQDSNSNENNVERKKQHKELFTMSVVTGYLSIYCNSDLK